MWRWNDSIAKPDSIMFLFLFYLFLFLFLLLVIYCGALVNIWNINSVLRSETTTQFYFRSFSIPLLQLPLLISAFWFCRWYLNDMTAPIPVVIITTIVLFLIIYTITLIDLFSNKEVKKHLKSLQKQNCLLKPNV